MPGGPEGLAAAGVQAGVPTCQLKVLVRELDVLEEHPIQVGVTTVSEVLGTDLSDQVAVVMAAEKILCLCKVILRHAPLIRICDRMFALFCCMSGWCYCALLAARAQGQQQAGRPAAQAATRSSRWRPRASQRTLLGCRWDCNRLPVKCGIIKDKWAGVCCKRSAWTACWPFVVCLWRAFGLLAQARYCYKTKYLQLLQCVHVGCLVLHGWRQHPLYGMHSVVCICAAIYQVLLSM
jgi:hypothetical protein